MNNERATAADPEPQRVIEGPVVSVVKVGPPAPAPDPVQEVDAWWGSYSAFAMLPSLLLCIGLTGLIAWGSWRFLERGYVQISILSLTGLVWLVQTMRWAYRVFGYNYRLTTHRLFQSKGLFYQNVVEVNLATIGQVVVKRSPHHFLAGIGQILITVDDAARTRIVLEGVSQPRQVAEHIRVLAEKARERQTKT